MNAQNKKMWLTGFAGLIFCILIRLVPFRAPNVEPILALQMPFAKHFGKGAGFFFGVLNIVFFDVLTGQVGYWTIITGITYGLVGAIAVYYFKKFNARRHYIYFSILGVIFYDAITGLSIGPLFFGQSFMAALVGQIPFTISHVAGSVFFTAGLSFFIDRMLSSDVRASESRVSLQMARL